MNRYHTKIKDIKLNDLIFVLLYGVFISTLIGIAIGLLEYTIQNTIGFSLFFILFFISSNFIGKMVRNQYEYPHIIYIVITGVFLVLQALLGISLPIMLDVVSGYGGIDTLLEQGFFFSLFWLVITNVVLTFSWQSLWLILIIGVGTYVGLRRTY